jgi:hypothetical protein
VVDLDDFVLAWILGRLVFEEATLVPPEAIFAIS